MLKEKTKLKRNEKRLLRRLNTHKYYKFFYDFFHNLFSFKKVFFTLAKSKFSKTIALSSVTFFHFLWRKLWYIDDVIVYKKQRWKWVWKRLLSKTLEKAKNENIDYALLISRKDRKVSHEMYKKFWFIIISFWVWIFAYKRIKTWKWTISRIFEKLFIRKQKIWRNIK